MSDNMDEPLYHQPLWVTRGGVSMEPCEMETSHIVNTINMLEKLSWQCQRMIDDIEMEGKEWSAGLSISNAQDRIKNYHWWIEVFNNELGARS